MNWMDSLEKRFGHLAIPGLIKVIVGFNALVFILLQTNPEFAGALTLEPGRILQGEVWRLFTYLFIPGTRSILFVLIGLYFLWFVGSALEEAWGSFRLNLFYLLGMGGCTIAAFFFGGDATNFYLNLSLLFAFTTLYPDFKLMLFLILPVQARWIGWISFFILVLSFLGGTMSARMAILVSMGNYLVFFGPVLVRNFRERREIVARRAKFESSQAEAEPLYRCHVCGRSDFTDPALEFRVAADGNDYCEEHLPGRKEA